MGERLSGSDKQVLKTYAKAAGVAIVGTAVMVGTFNAVDAPKPELPPETKVAEPAAEYAPEAPGDPIIIEVSPQPVITGTEISQSHE